MKRKLKTPKLSRRQKILVPLGIILLVLSIVFGIMKFRDVFYSQPQDTAADQPVIADEINEPENAAEVESKPEEAETPKPKPASAPDTPGPLEGVGTLSWVVNKRRPLNPKTYIPPNLVKPSVKLRVAGITVRSDAAAALQQLFAAGLSAGHDPMLSSGYRSYNAQASLYNSYAAKDGQAAADTYSARPGYSEHQTGLAMDVCNAGACSLEQSFAATPFGQWLAAHAHEYGFIIRYPSGKQHITGYIYEPWHLRYVGTGLAAQIYASGKTLEEHFGLPAAPTYL